MQWDHSDVIDEEEEEECSDRYNNRRVDWLIGAGAIRTLTPNTPSPSSPPRLTPIPISTTHYWQAYSSWAAQPTSWLVWRWNERRACTVTQSLVPEYLHTYYSHTFLCRQANKVAVNSEERRAKSEDKWNIERWSDRSEVKGKSESVNSMMLHLLATLANGHVTTENKIFVSPESLSVIVALFWGRPFGCLDAWNLKNRFDEIRYSYVRQFFVDFQEKVDFRILSKSQ